MALVIIPAAQVDGIALAAALGHPHHVDEKAQALIGPGRQKFKMAQMGHVHYGFSMHDQLSNYGGSLIDLEVQRVSESLRGQGLPFWEPPRHDGRCSRSRVFCHPGNSH